MEKKSLRLLIECYCLIRQAQCIQALTVQIKKQDLILILIIYNENTGYFTTA